MNELYELAIESAEIELMVTEGVTDKTKDLVNKIIEKVKAFVKKMIQSSQLNCVNVQKR